MSLYKFTNGTNADADEVNANQKASMLLELKNHTRSLIDRAGVYSADGSDLWGEAFPTSGGINVGVALDGNTTAAYYESDDSYGPANDGAGSPVTDANGWSWTNDGAVTSFAGLRITPNSDILVTTVTKHSSVTATRAVIRTTSGQTLATATFSGDDATFTTTLLSGIEYEIGADSNGASYTKYKTSNATYPQADTNITWTAGFSGGTSTTSALNILSITSSTGAATAGAISMTLPTGTFSATSSSAVLGSLLDKWEVGSNIQFKLTNSTEDSGWLEADDIVQTFTAFTTLVIAIFYPHIL